MGELRVQLFGHFRLVYHGAPLTTFKTPRLQALLAFLVLNPGKPQFRYQIAYTFWPDSREEQARTNLRNLLHLLRQALPDSQQFIAFESQTLQWRTDAPYTFDVNEFERLVAPAPGVHASRDNLERAVLLYQGELLPGCYEDWIYPERERLRRAYLASLEALAEITEKAREYTSALEYTRRLVQAEPTHSTANHQLIRLYALDGNRPAALKAYQIFARRLSADLGIQPDQETRDLYEALKAHRPKASQPAKAPGITPILVGRESEWQRLLSAWKNSSAGNPQMVFICGEAGIGKSRLIEELVEWANRQDIHTAAAHCYPVEGSLPYAPVVAWLRALPLPSLEELWLTEISRLLPEIFQSHPQLPKPGPLSEAWQRQRLFEALARGILSNRQKLLLVIEDLQWCDRDTMEWMNYLLRFEATAPLMILASVRMEEMTPKHPIQDFQTALTALGKSSQIELKPLDQAECFQLASQVALQASRSPLDPGLAAHLYKQTEGNPLFIVETVRLGYLTLADSSTPAQDAPLSEKAQAVLKRRIAQLSLPARELACLAATIGRQFNLSVLLQASGIKEEELINSLDELILRQIIREEAPDQYDFSHDKLRETTFVDLSTAHRRLLHRKVAEAYMELAARQPDPRYAEIASHYEQAGLALPAVKYYRQAALAAANIYANTEGIVYLQHAIALASTLSPGPSQAGTTPQDLALLHESLGDLLALTGDYSPALEQYLAAQDQPFHQPPVWKSCLYRKISSAQISLYRHADARASLDLAEGCVHGDSILEHEQQEWIDLQFARAQLFYWTNSWHEMDSILDQVQSYVEAFGRADQYLELLSIEYQYYLRLERYRLTQATVNLARHRRQLCLESGNASKIAYADFQLGFALLWGGDAVSAQEYLRTALSSFDITGARTNQARCLTYLSIASRKLKQVEALRRQADDLLKLTEAIGEYAYQGVAWANKAWLAWSDGDAEQTLKFGQKALDDWHRYPGAYVFHWLALWPLLAVALDQGNLDLAERCAAGMLDPEQQPLLEPLPELLQTALHELKTGDIENAYQSLRGALDLARLQGDL